MAKVIGLDLGTTTITGVVWDTEQGEILRLARRRNDSALKPASPTRAEEDTGRLQTLALQVLAELAAAGDPVEGLAMTGQMHGLICVDGESRPLTPLISWQDHRTAEPLADGSTTLEQMHARLADLDWTINGCQLQHGYGAATLFWLEQQGELPAGTQRICTLTGWLTALLTSRPAVTDPTFAASWGVYDVVDHAWNGAFLERLGLDERLFPPVQPPGERLGGLAPDVAQQVGLPPGLPVFNPLGDTQATFLGSVADVDGAVMVGLGTGGRICWLAPGFEPPSERVETRPLPQRRYLRRYLRVGASLCGGEAYAWLNRTVRAWLAEFGAGVAEEAVYERLNALAAERGDTAGLRVRTTFLGVRGDPAIQAGAIEGITLETMDLGALARATLLGTVDELHGFYAGHGGQGAGHSHVVATGGAIRNNPLLPGLIGERFGLPVETLELRETGAVGAIKAALLPRQAG
jgi:sugar (pentulose or hexulose) kinase